ncbi:MAG: arylsulfatase [Planctomycetota bacterium]|nr:arylsulfatase [Planctomycetota bacterium]
MKTGLPILLAFGLFSIPGLAETKPNIIYILADDLGYGDLGCYGQKDIQTPHVDQLAKAGIRFTQHYAGSNICAPARCVFITGLHTGHCYIRNNKPLPFEGNAPIPADSQTIPKLLKTAGYRTGAMGKWGLGYPGSSGDPTRQGFDHFFGYNCQRQAHSYYPPHLWRNTEKVILEGNSKGQKKQYSHDLLTDEALQFIRDNQSRPFFLYLPYTIPHTAFQVPDLGIYKDKSWTTSQKTQAAMITRLDRDVGRIVALLKELGLDKNTLVVFTSDNGPHGAGGTLPKFNAAGPLRARKGSMYEGGIRVPFVASWPGKIKPGTESDHISCFQDMLPTFAEMAGVNVPGRTDGISMLPALLGKETQKKHQFLYWERAGSTAVRQGKWKAVHAGKGAKRKLELYDLEADIGETKDLAADFPEIARRMLQIMEDSHEDSPFFTLNFDEIARQRGIELKPGKRKKKKRK